MGGFGTVQRPDDMASQDQYQSNSTAAAYDIMETDGNGVTYATQANVIDIPLRDDQEVVTLNLDEDLPDDPTELCDLLENEEAGRQFWLAIGVCVLFVFNTLN